MFKIGDRIRVVRIMVALGLSDTVTEDTSNHYSKYKNEIGTIKKIDSNARFEYIVKFDNPLLVDYLNWHDKELEHLNKNRRIIDV